MHRLLGLHQVWIRFQNWPRFNANLFHFFNHVGWEHQVACALFLDLLCLALPVKSEMLTEIGETVFLLEFYQEVFMKLEEGLKFFRLKYFMRKSAVLAFLTVLGSVKEFARQLGQIV